jgi:cobalt-precorrin 5A hydrolase
MLNEAVIIAHTEKGTRLGEDLAKKMEIRLRAPQRFLANPDEQCGFSRSMTSEIQDLFLQERILIFIMELETAIRVIAPLLNNRNSDPAVLLLDEAGNYAIPLCSGSKNKLQYLIKTITETIGARPIITSGTERSYIPAIEDLAERYQLKIETRELIPKFGEAFLNGEALVVWDSWGLNQRWPENVRVETDQNAMFLEDDRFLLVIGYQLFPSVIPVKMQVMALRPLCLRVGIACDGETATLKMVGAIRRYFREANWSIRSILQIVALDSPLYRNAILETGRDLGVAVKLYSAAELKMRDQFTGLFMGDCVIEPDQIAENLALTGCEQGRLIGNRRRIDQVSLAVAMNADIETSA